MSDKSAATEQRFNALYNVLGPVAADVAIADITGTGLKTVSQSPQQIPGGSIAAGQRYEVDAAGTFSMGATPPTAVTFSIYYGATGGGNTLGDLNVPAAGRFGGASSVAWGLHADVVWLSATEAVCKIVLDWHTAGGEAGSVVYFIVADHTGLDTTGGHVLVLAFQRTGGTSMTLTTSYAHFSRAA